jgi:hypothetical protein
MGLIVSPLPKAAPAPAAPPLTPHRFGQLGSRELVWRFDGGDITSDGGGLLLKHVEERTAIVRRLAACFTDYRAADRIEHPLVDLVGQRVYGLALGYEDLNDHEELRRDPMLAAILGKDDPKGENRRRARDRGKALAGKSTLNRLELTPADFDPDCPWPLGEKPPASPPRQYKKIVVDPESIDRLMVGVFVEAHLEPPACIILDLDATDDPLHGHQEGRFFHGYYDEYCYLPLYIFCGEHLLCARLRTANVDGAADSVEEVARIVAQLRLAWPNVRIILRGDSGFCREALMAWCEAERVDYVFGVAQNARLSREVEAELAQAAALYEATKEPARVFKEFQYSTRETWSRARRVVAKAEHLAKGANPRFVVSSLPVEEYPAQALYEHLYCARGDMENRIKEQQLDLFADRTSSHKMWANQLRLYWSSMAYLLLQALRRLGLGGTEMAKAQCQTIRLKLLKIGAQVRVTVRKVWVSLASGCPYAELFARAMENLAATPLRC